MPLNTQPINTTTTYTMSTISQLYDTILTNFLDQQKTTTTLSSSSTTIITETNNNDNISTQTDQILKKGSTTTTSSLANGRVKLQSQVHFRSKNFGYKKNVGYKNVWPN